MRDFEKEWKTAIVKCNEAEISKVAEAIYEKYIRLVFKVSYTILLNREDAEDVSQDVFVSFFSNRDKNSDVKNIKYYLLNSAKYIAYRKKLKEEKVCEFEEDRASEDFQLPIESILFAMPLENDEKLLSEEEADVVIKHLEYGFSFREIGENANRTTHSVSGLYRRAIQKLQSYYGEKR